MVAVAAGRVKKDERPNSRQVYLNLRLLINFFWGLIEKLFPSTCTLISVLRVQLGSVSPSDIEQKTALCQKHTPSLKFPSAPLFSATQRNVTWKWQWQGNITKHASYCHYVSEPEARPCAISAHTLRSYYSPHLLRFARNLGGLVRAQASFKNLCQVFHRVWKLTIKRGNDSFRFS